MKPTALAVRNVATGESAEAARVLRRWFRRGVLAVVGLCGVVYGYGLGSWPWDVDELSSLEEMEFLDPSVHEAVRTPESFLTRLPRLVPVWYAVQEVALELLPRDELGTRVLPAACGVLTVACLFAFGWGWRGPLFAAALALLAGASPLMVWLSQQNRFYSMAMLFLVLATWATWSRRGGPGAAVAAVAFTLLAVLTHNVLIVLFCLVAAAACAAWVLSWAPGAAALRSAACGAAAVVVYFLHVRPIAGEWTGAGFAWTHPFVSFVAHVGAPTVALSAFGCAAALAAPGLRRPMAVWAGTAAFVGAFVVAAPLVMPVWNARYALLFALPLWVTGALAIEVVARQLLARQAAEGGGKGDGAHLPRSGPEGASHKWAPSPFPAVLTVCWYGCVALLLTPKLASHWVDGMRHDYRRAAAVAAELAVGDGDESPSSLRASERTGPVPLLSQALRPILTDMELQTRYYLPGPLRPACRFRAPGSPLPPGECVVIVGGNIWDPVLRLQDRRVDLAAQIGRRRFDELSHVVRVYRVHAEADPRPATLVPRP